MCGHRGKGRRDQCHLYGSEHVDLRRAGSRMRTAMLLCSIVMTSFLLVPRITWQGYLQAHRLASGSLPLKVDGFPILW
jgi:hypothetical protein